MDKETIAAIATGVVEAGIGIVRVSGSEAVRIGDRVFRPDRGRPLSARPTHTLVYGRVHEGLETVDEALAVIMRGPRSFTGEDVLEIHCHGGRVALQRVLGTVVRAGARTAEPGEFTRRAFMNGRVDLAQAEAVIDVIRAKTDRAMVAAVRQLEGALSGPIRVIRDRLLEAMAHLEAEIDFPELDLEAQTAAEVASICESCLIELKRLVGGARRGKILREGLRVVLVGRPNVGKSSLMNRLVGESRSIVTEIPGTTRDVVEEWVSLRGIPLSLSDTAGIRPTDDPVERLGVERSRRALEQSDIVLLVIEAPTGFTEEDGLIAQAISDRSGVLVVANKVDLLADPNVERLTVLRPDWPVVGVSAETGVGVDRLEEVLIRLAGAQETEESFLANARQEEALQRAIDALEAAMATYRAGFGSDLVSVEIRAGWTALGEIIGESVGEDLLDQIFSRFCIGK